MSPTDLQILSGIIVAVGTAIVGSLWRQSNRIHKLTDEQTAEIKSSILAVKEQLGTIDRRVSSLENIRSKAVLRYVRSRAVSHLPNPS